MTYYELWVMAWELFVGVGNYIIVQGISDILFVIFVGAFAVVIFLSPFLMIVVLGKVIRGLGWNS